MLISFSGARLCQHFTPTLTLPLRGRGFCARLFTVKGEIDRFECFGIECCPLKGQYRKLGESQLVPCSPRTHPAGSSHSCFTGIHWLRKWSHAARRAFDAGAASYCDFGAGAGAHGHDGSGTHRYDGTDAGTHGYPISHAHTGTDS